MCFAVRYYKPKILAKFAGGRGVVHRGP
jgi:hypothetical protein